MSKDSSQERVEHLERIKFSSKKSLSHVDCRSINSSEGERESRERHSLEKMKFFGMSFSFSFSFSLLLLLNVEKSSSVECIYSSDSLDWSWLNVNWSELEEEVKDLSVSDYDQSKNELCRLEIYFDYRLNVSSISFGDSFPWSELSEGEMRLDYLIRLEAGEEEEQFYNVLEYACANEDQCERKILFAHLQWLTDIDYSLFHQHLHQLFFKQSNATGSTLSLSLSLSLCVH